MGPWAAGDKRERKNSQPLRTKGRHPLANLPRCATPGQSEAAHTIFQHRVAGQSNHGAQVPSRLDWRGRRRRRLPQTARGMMRSKEDSEEQTEDWTRMGLWPALAFLPHPILSRRPRRQVAETDGGHWQTANSPDAFVGLVRSQVEGRRPRGSLELCRSASSNLEASRSATSTNGALPRDATRSGPQVVVVGSSPLPLDSRDRW